MQVVRSRGIGSPGLEPGDPGPQLAKLIPQLPVRLGEPFQASDDPSRPEERAAGENDRRCRQEPLEGQQNSYLTERLATVSTACDNTGLRATA